MARQSQGLQIALIIFVMLTVVLGVTTFLFYRRYDEALQAAQSARDGEVKEKNHAASKEAECDDLKQMMGLPRKSLKEVKDQFDKDMATYGANFPEDSRLYSPMLRQLWDAITDHVKEVEKLAVEKRDLEARFATREAAHDARIAKTEADVKTFGEQERKISADYKTERDRALEDQVAQKKRADEYRKERQVAIDKAETVAQEANARIQQLAKLNEEKSKKIEKISRPTMDVPSGEVRWVNQHNGTVWINLGRADSLERQVSFSVYSADTTDLSKAAKKATIEVTKILGEHVSEARILDDKIADPIMPGDKIHTPLWTPGEQTHFALAGFMDLDGDGRNALATVRRLITMNGGIVDCEIDERGKRTGEMTIQTRYLVLGAEPSTKGQADAIQAYSRMVSDAERLGVRKMSLTELKQRMGYKKQNTVERFGSSSTAPTHAPSTTPKAGGGAPAKKP